MLHETRSPWRFAFGLLLLAMIAVSGCGKSKELDSPTAVKMKGIANFYLEYAISRGQGPADEKEMKKHLRGVPDFALKANGIDSSSLDSLFVSDRDNEPLVVMYGAKVSATKGMVVAHEKTGKKGKRLVVYADSKVEEVDEDKFKELTTAKQ